MSSIFKARKCTVEKCKTTGKPCPNPCVEGYDKCRMHGGGGGRPKKDGSPPEGKLVRMQRQDFIRELQGADGEKAKRLISGLYLMAVDGSLPAITYCLDQMFGTAKSTTVIEIGDRELFADLCRVTAQFLQGDKFEEWLVLASEVIGSRSSSMSSLPSGAT